ncbi:ABC transporter permease [Aureimonas phyllosphaerae]|uniref:Iron(III) transport system permease protein n=1 Tax=Aureimonas phyllosphaerae TaxID=1166078 RepID=A0A7W6BQW7_9HYPH|nr:iron ABC transporter permease [Aureimonas phyllosphaerae]MBB3936439.1 iron(III) transport system permease protein [Aureimonas phyllosphaerae]MBB3960697.1 iron(III) transport system permease protein [Aureimonas phyllosphaerae]SFF30234.1 iron(III) transport system permease protein [Aureimonas phyllosphaerae]
MSELRLGSAGVSPARRASVGSERLFLAAALAVGLLAALPVLSLAAIALTGGTANWSHLARTVLPRATGTTLALMAGVGVATAVVGTFTAWLVTSFRFPGQRVFAWALVLPLAVPTYIAAYCFNELLHYVGPVQSGLRALFGWTTRSDYWFPDIRSAGGAVLVLSSVLYPYVFLTVRLVFLMQGRKAADVARTLGAGRLRILATVLLPMARPAIAVGVALVLMETVNDIGAVEFLGVQTLTFAVYATWLNRGDLAGATQIALLMLAFILLLLWVERFARRRQRFTAGRSDTVRAGAEQLAGWKGWAAAAACLVPIASGFGVPLAILGGYAFRRPEDFADPQLWRALQNTIVVAGSTALLTVAIGFLVAYGIRLTNARPLRVLSRLAAFGYAVPGTILAMGILVPFAAFDNALDAALRAAFGVSTGLLLSGSGFAIVFACTARFMAMGHGSLDNGFARLSPHLDMASRALGHGPGGTLRRVLLPLMRPALLTAMLLVFVEAAKELSATILLRPFDFDTLATFVYAQASRAAFEDGAIASLLIVATGILPVVVLTRSLARDGRPRAD